MKHLVFLFLVIMGLVVLSVPAQSFAAGQASGAQVLLAQSEEGETFGDEAPQGEMVSVDEALKSSGTCTVNGKQVPCDEFWDRFGGLFIAIWIIAGIIAIGGGAFWLWMLVDCIKRDFADKTVWIIVLLIGGGVGAIIYYFMIKRAGTASPKPGSPPAPQQSPTQPAPPPMQA